MTADWSRFYEALCRLGPEILDAGDMVEIFEAASASDMFWEPSLQPLLEDTTADHGIRVAVLATTRAWVEHVNAVFATEFGIDLPSEATAINEDAPFIEELIAAATRKPVVR